MLFACCEFSFILCFPSSPLCLVLFSFANICVFVCSQGYGASRPPTPGSQPSNGPSQPPGSAPSNGPPYSGPGEYPPPPPPHQAHSKPGPGHEGGEGPHPPPPPSKHEGPPASTWTPPVHNRQFPHSKVTLRPAWQHVLLTLYFLSRSYFISLTLNCPPAAKISIFRVRQAQAQVPEMKQR